jgi:hypothetical protein
MSDCLNAQLPYAVPQTIDPSFLSSAINQVGPGVDRNVSFAQLNPASQIFALETAMALQTQATHDKVYGGNPYDDSDSIDYLVGWFEACLEKSGLRPEENDASPNSAWSLYATYLGVSPNADISNAHMRYFMEGYTTNSPSLPPPSLMPPKPPGSGPGLIPRKPG